MRRNLTRSLLLLLVFAPARAGANGAHVHGTGELHVAIEANRLSIELHSPLENLLGFEHAPRTDEQRSAAKAMFGELKRTASLFRIPIEAGCISAAPRIDSPGVADAQAGTTAKSDADGPAGRHAAEHPDVTVEYEFACTDIGRIDSIEVNLFDAFPGMKRLDAQVAGPHGQAAKSLSPGQRVLRF